MPRLETAGGTQQLWVDGKPFLLLAGELHNSSSSCADYMEPIWDRLAGLGLNTVLAAVSWEMIEPEEGRFEFGAVDALLAAARRRALRLVPLWFGTWKNAVSTYSPPWVKGDMRRFFRARNRQNEAMHAISPFCEEAIRADARAFAALMQHLAEVDGADCTVVMAQVENETGLLGTPRDMAPAACAAFAGPAPEELLARLAAERERLEPELLACWTGAGGRCSGTWTEVFGQGADEVFMAWHTARCVERVAAAGKARYALPLFANAWLAQDEKQAPGEYPSGGPVAGMQDVWRAAAPSLDLLAPDIYLADFRGVCARYARGGRALLIPEARWDARAASTPLYAFGRHAAIGFAPFAIDDVAPGHPLAESYAFLRALMPDLCAAQAGGRVTAFLQQADQEAFVEELAGVRVRATTTGPLAEGRVPGGALVLALAPGEYLVAGREFFIEFSPLDSDAWAIELLRCEEGRYENGAWVRGRILNGDETNHGLAVPLGAAFAVRRVRLNLSAIPAGRHIEWEFRER